MSNVLWVNDVLEFDSEHSERILWIDLEYQYCFTIELWTKTLKVRTRQISEIEKSLDEGTIKLAKKDPIYRNIDEKSLSVKSRELLESANEIIDYINQVGEPDIYYKNIRANIVNRAVKIFQKSKVVIYKYLRKYWQGGKIATALVSAYYNCGSNGKDRKLSDKKLGRPNHLVRCSNIISEASTNENIHGINIDLSTRKIIQTSLNRYYWNQKEITLVQAYDLMLQDFFSEIVEDDEGREERRVLPANQIPTFWQFKYWHYRLTNANLDECYKKRKGEKAYNLLKRGQKSNSTYEAKGPGFRYQIDSTIPGVQLVNRLKNKNIGKPTVYFVIDVYSRMVVGIYVGLEHASWESMSSALYNCTEDKVEFCREFGVEIEPHEWPNSTLPNVLLADRGSEMLSRQGDNAIKNLRIMMENAPSGRGDLKGAVEQSFHLAERKFKHWLPGAIMNDYRKRGERDPKKDAVVDIDEFTRIVIRVIIHHNNRVMTDYEKIMPRQMINSGIKAKPVDIWKWGLKHKSGALTRFPADFIKKNLMRNGKAIVTEKGLKFNGVYYDAQNALNEGWYSKAKIKGYFAVDILYDQRNSDEITVVNPKTGENRLFYLKKEYSAFRGLTMEELKNYEAITKEEKLHNRDYSNQNNLKMNDGIRSDVEKSKEAFKEVRADRHSMLKDMDVSRALEKEDYSKEQAFRLSETNQRDSIDNDESQEDDFDDYLIDKIQEIKRRGTANA